MFSLKKKLNLSEQGYSLIELMIVMIIIAVVAGGVIPLFFSAISANKASKNKLYAYEAAHSEIEKMRSEDFASISNHNFTISNMPLATGNVTVDNNVEGAPRTNILKVITTVSWDYKGKYELITLVTYIAEKGINQ